VKEIEPRLRDAERRLFARHGLAPAERWLALDEHALRVRVLEVGSGPPLVLLHAAGWFAAQWTPLLPHLAGRRLLLIDLPGHGLSGGLEYRRAPARGLMSAALRGVLAALGLPAVPVVGSSLGGMAALWLALDAPERVDRLVLLGLPGSALPGARPDLGLALMSVPGVNRLLLRLPASPERSRALSRRPFGTAFARTPGEIFEIHYLASRRPEFVQSVASFLEATLRWRTPRPGSVLAPAEIAAIAQPTLFVWGADDVYGPPAIAERALALMPRAELEVVPGGHFPHLDDPAGCAARIARFLAPRGAGNGARRSGHSRAEGEA
jgi:pimeloyl-ACP methyl ester carboxylesterase